MGFVDDDNIDRMLAKLEKNIDKITDEALEKAAEVVKESIKSSCAAVQKGTGTGELNKAWKAQKVRRSEGAASIYVTVTGKRKGKRAHRGGNKRYSKKYNVEATNRDIAYFLEYGNKHQPARPYIDKAQRDSEEKVYEILEKSVEGAVE